jgi:hypothetical protein
MAGPFGGNVKYRIERLQRLFTNKAGEHIGWRPVKIGTRKRNLEFDTLPEAVSMMIELYSDLTSVRILEVDGAVMREVTADELQSANPTKDAPNVESELEEAHPAGGRQGQAGGPPPRR